jgi:hypothetical protein
MYQNTYVTAAVGAQRQADLMTAAQHARELREARTRRRRPRLRLGRARRRFGVPIPSIAVARTAS